MVAVNRTRDAKETLKHAKEKGFASDALVELDAELNGWTKPDETTQTEPLASDKPQAEENKQEPPQETVDELITQFNYGDFFRVLKKTKTLVQQYPTAFIFWHIQGTVNIRLGELEYPLAALSLSSSSKIPPVHRPDVLHRLPLPQGIWTELV